MKKWSSISSLDTKEMADLTDALAFSIYMGNKEAAQTLRGKFDCELRGIMFIDYRDLVLRLIHNDRPNTVAALVKNDPLQLNRVDNTFSKSLLEEVADALEPLSPVDQRKYSDVLKDLGSTNAKDIPAARDTKVFITIYQILDNAPLHTTIL